MALRLFDERGFAATTVEDIASELGVARRTVFRYFPSKSDIVWGDFDQVLRRLNADLAAGDSRLPLTEWVARAVISSNAYPPEQQHELRTRMSLITGVPALQAHSMLRYAAWRQIIAEHVARRESIAPDALLPQTVGHVALGASMSAFGAWVADPSTELSELLTEAWSTIGQLGARRLSG